jgi:hypothetical protein
MTIQQQAQIAIEARDSGDLRYHMLTFELHRRFGISFEIINAQIEALATRMVVGLNHKVLLEMILGLFLIGSLSLGILPQIPIAPTFLLP